MCEGDSSERIGHSEQIAANVVARGSPILLNRWQWIRWMSRFGAVALDGCNRATQCVDHDTFRSIPVMPIVGSGASMRTTSIVVGVVGVGFPGRGIESI